MASTPLPTICQLPPPDLVLAYSIKLNNSIISHLKASKDSNYAPKLVVKQGKFFLRVSPDTVYPLTRVPENLTVDVYDLQEGKEPKFNGRIESRLTVNTECAPPLQYSSKKLVINYGTDDKPTILQKVLVFMSLGPCSLETLINHTHLKENDPLIQQYLQRYDPNDQFTKDDVFPFTPHDISNTFICKDRAYKEIRVYNTSPASILTPSQRSLIINNINRALTRLGFLDTHPLRNKLTSATAVLSTSTPNSPANTNIAVGGGGLSSSTPVTKQNTTTTTTTTNVTQSVLKLRKEVSPKKKQVTSSTASSLIPASIPPRPVTPKPGTPLASRKRIRTISSASSSSSSEDERVKRVRADHHHLNSTIPITSTASSITSPSSLDDDVNVSLIGLDEKKPNYYETILDRFHKTYTQYQALYTQLEHAIPPNGVAGSTPTTASMLSPETKRKLARLFEWHNSLTLWKRMLWDHQRDKQKSKDIMNLTKHKKSASLSAIQQNNNNNNNNNSSSALPSSLPVPVPNGLSSIRASYNSVKAHSASPGLPPTTIKQTRLTPKMSLDY
ncbi:uncharacterized protein KQ657_005231 [Scheffersomyces spartinae]|uniref:Uncharacterized protein n=1 Tax=Scheffersomyces spartinae TaxID=45513 RepID=A0A9P7VA43_9ASCO|nr:uncharacterized protein KQ657_005231 [Scheffersomyces spartinae]KAG7194028.1 hypothetical protein KQ657_005231 [Scheffersomyces spartinae]